DGLVRMYVDERRQVPGLSAHHLGDGLTAGADEAVIGHPLVVVDLGQIAPTRIGEQHHDHVVGTELTAELDGGPYGRAARPPGQDALLPGGAPGHDEGVPVAHHDDPVDHEGVVGTRPEILPDPLDQVRTAA